MFEAEHLQWGELQEAAGLLAARGYGGVRAQELARVTQRSVGSLYRQYGNKAGVARAVRAESERALAWRGTCAWRAADTAAGDFCTPFLAVWDALANWAGEQPALFAFTYLHPAVEDAGEDGPPWAQDETQARELLAEVLGAGLVRGVLRPAPVWLLVGVVWGALAELVRASHVRGRRLDNEEIALAGETVWGALRKAPAQTAGGGRGGRRAGAFDHPLHARRTAEADDDAAGGRGGTRGDRQGTAQADAGADLRDATRTEVHAGLGDAAPPGAHASPRPAAPAGGDANLGDAASPGARTGLADAGSVDARPDACDEGRPRDHAAGPATGRASGADLDPGPRSPLDCFLETVAPAAEDLGAGPPAADDPPPAAEACVQLRTVEEVLRRWPRGTNEERWFAQTAMDNGELTLELYLAWREALWKSPAMVAQHPLPPELERFRDMWDDPAWDDVDDER